MTKDIFVGLLEEYGTLGDVIVSLHNRLKAVETLIPYIPVLQKVLAGQVAPEGSAVDILAMDDEQRRKLLGGEENPEQNQILKPMPAEETVAG